MTLKEGQYQIGDLVFGAGTQLTIDAMDQIGYGITPGDMPRPNSDEIAMKKDWLQPGTISFNVNAVDNYLLPHTPQSGVTYPAIQRAEDLMESFMQEWRADEIREIYGAVKPLTYKRMGKVRRVYGRPRDMASQARRMQDGWFTLSVAYQRVDTVVYSDEVYGLIDKGVTAVGVNDGVLTRQPDAKGATWFEIYITGPIVNPTVNIGPYQIQLQYTLASGELVQINSYPWSRRAVSSSGQNIATKMIGTSPYLSELKFKPGATLNAGLHGTGQSASTKMTIAWREAYLSF